MSPSQIAEIVERISFRDWRFEVRMDGERPYLQVAFTGPCPLTGKVEDWKGRKWFLSEHMTRSEIVQTAFLAVMVATEHETREHFMYQGKPIFGPHIAVDRLLGICEHLDVREEHGTVIAAGGSGG